MIYRSSFPFIFFLILFVGCRTGSNLNLGTRTINSTQVQDLSRAHHTFIQSMRGQGKISVETPEFAQSGSFLLTLRKPDSILINLQGPFGIKVGSALVTRTDFSFYNSLENKLVSGSTNTENLSRILHVQLSFDDLMNIFAGGQFLNDDLRSPDETLTENDQYVFIYHSQTSSRKYWIDPVSLCIQKIQLIGRDGKLVLEQSFGDFEYVDGVEMPYSIRMTQTTARQMLTLHFSDITINAVPLPFLFTIPQNAERIRW